MREKINKSEIPRRLQRQIDVIDKLKLENELNKTNDIKIHRSLRRKKTFKKVVFYIASIFLASLLFTAIVYLQNYFRISRFEVNSESKPINLIGLEMYYSKNLFLLNLADFDKYIKGRNPQIKSLRSEKKYPSTVALQITLYKPEAELEVGQGGYFVLGPDGRILQKSKHKPTLPVIKYTQKLSYATYNLGDRVDFSDIQSALFFLQKASDLGIVVDTIDIAGRSMIRLNQKKRQIVFTTEKDKNLQIYQLEKIIKQFAISGREFKVLDLRYERVLISN